MNPTRREFVAGLMGMPILASMRRKRVTPKPEAPVHEAADAPKGVWDITVRDLIEMVAKSGHFEGKR